jgi:hypothetical protein
MAAMVPAVLISWRRSARGHALGCEQAQQFGAQQ